MKYFINKKKLKAAYSELLNRALFGIHTWIGSHFHRKEDVVSKEAVKDLDDGFYFHYIGADEKLPLIIDRAYQNGLKNGIQFQKELQKRSPGIETTTTNSTAYNPKLKT